MSKSKIEYDSFEADLVHYADLLPKIKPNELVGKNLVPLLSISNYISKENLAGEIFKNLPGTIYITDFPQLSVLWLNMESLKTLGYSEKEIKSADPDFFIHIIHPDDLGMVGGVVEFFNKKKGNFFRCAYRLKHANGNYIWYYGTSAVFKRNENGDPVLLIGFSMDIFSQIHSDTKLRELLHENLQLRNKLIIKSLTKRQKEIMILIAEGFTSKQIGEKLIISNYTVETHRKNILKKLNFHNSAEMVKFTIENLQSEII